MYLKWEAMPSIFWGCQIWSPGDHSWSLHCIDRDYPNFMLTFSLMLLLNENIIFHLQLSAMKLLIDMVVPIPGKDRILVLILHLTVAVSWQRSYESVMHKENAIIYGKYSNWSRINIRNIVLVVLNIQFWLPNIYNEYQLSLLIYWVDPYIISVYST